MSGKGDSPGGAKRLDFPLVKFGEALRFWVKLGFINFGGPAGQIAVMHNEIVGRRGWISEGRFLRALNFCMMLPGPEAQQLATYIGWQLHGLRGAISAGVFFVLPSVFVLLALSALAVSHADVPWVMGLFYGIQPVVVAIVVEAVIRIGRRTLVHPALIGFAVAAFAALAWLSLPFPLVVAAAALAGAMFQNRWPEAFRSNAPARNAHGDTARAEGAAGDRSPSLVRTAKLLAIFLALWLVPVGALMFWRGGSDVLVAQAGFFTKAAFVTFGGAYAVLSYIADVAVNDYGWLTAEQMIQGLGLAESTPGPLIMVTQYVGFLGAYRFHGGYDPLLNGTLGAVVTTYVTFLPSFLFILAGAPYIEALAGNRRLQAALAGVTAAVVGVILSLSVFFARRVLFSAEGAMDVFALALAAASLVALTRFEIPVPALVLIGAGIGMIRFLI